MMKKISFLIIVITFSWFLEAQELLTKDQQDLQQTVVKFFDALSNRDSVSLKNYCTRDIALYENGRIWNADTLILKAITLNTATDFRRTNSFDFINTSVNGNTAWVTYNLHAEIKTGGKNLMLQWMETVVAVKKNRKWKINVLHSTLINRP
jgi:ketosteroid isomerase-like protein